MRARLRLYLVVSLLTVLLALPRFAHHTPDSRRYIAVAKYFRGEVAREGLLGPFAYRILVPFVAAQLPSDNLDFNFAVINVLATILAYLMFIPYLKRFVATQTDFNVGMLLLVVSFPSFNYASGVLTDPVGFLAFVVASYLLLNESYFLFSCAVCVGLLARESVLFMVPAAMIYAVMGYLGHTGKNWRKLWAILAVVAIPPALVFLGDRAYFSDVPNPHHYAPSLWKFLASITRTVSWMTFGLTLGPTLLLCLIGLRHDGLKFFSSLADRERRLLFSMTIVAAVSVLQLMSSMWMGMSGRFVWPYYNVLIPLAVLSSNRTTLFMEGLGPIANRIFGASDNGEK